jgi:CP family cyanate transporter-like MFS transporter
VPPSHRRSAGLGPTVAALFLVALALRPPLVGIGPLLPAIQRDLGIGHAPAGLLGAIPVLCMGVFAPLGSWLARRIGAEAAVTLAVAAIAGFGLLRAAAPEFLSVVATTFAIGIGIGLVGPVLPIVVHDRVPDRPAFVTGVYASGIILGATVAGAVAVPLAGPSGDWRRTLAVFALAAAGSLLVWLVLERPTATRIQAGPATDGGRPATDPPPIPWRDRRGWALALVFGLQSVLFYAVVAWLPLIQIERGWDEASAGFLVAVMNGISLVSVLGVPALADRRGERRFQLVASTLLSLVGLLGLTTAPGLVLLWVCVLGLGLGAVFPLAMTLPVDLAADPHEVGRLAAIMLLGGYVLSAVGPLLLGILRDGLGDFEAGLWLLVATAGGLGLASWRLIPSGLGRRVEAEPTVG